LPIEGIDDGNTDDENERRKTASCQSKRIHSTSSSTVPIHSPYDSPSLR
jgi:hypothetical protein